MNNLRFIRKTILFNIIISVLLLFIFKDQIFEIINNRVFFRSKELLSEEVDQAIQLFLYKNPYWLFFGTGTGNIHNLATEYISNWYLYFHKKGEIFVSRYGYMKIISENGILGFILFLKPFLHLKSLPLSTTELKFVRNLIFFTFVFFLIRGGYVEVELFFFTSLFISLYNLKNVHSSDY